MISLSSPNFSIFMVILLHFHHSVEAQSKDMATTDCEIIRSIVRVDYSLNIITNLIISCSSGGGNDDPGQGISAAFQNNATTMQCGEEVAAVRDINTIMFRDCVFTSLPKKLFNHFKNVSVLELDELSLGELRIDDIPVIVKHPNLHALLDLSYNNFAYIGNGAFGHQNAVEHLSIRNNHLRRLEAATFTGLSELTFLGLAYNAIVNITAGAFLPMPKLETLYLEHNQIGEIGDSWFGADSKLSELDLSANNIVSLRSSHFRNLRNLTALYLSSNQLIDIPEATFAALTKLEGLYLSNNKIRGIGDLWFNESNELGVLDLSNNHIGELKASNFRYLPNLWFLNVTSNRIVELPEQIFNHLTKLETLFLNHNQIHSIADTWFTKNNSLAVVRLSFNNITELRRRQFAHLRKLEGLEVSHSQVSSIETGTFVPLSKLFTLDLSYNRLKEFDGATLFTPVRNQLTWVHLDSNELQELPDAIDETFPELATFSIKSNHINCVFLKVKMWFTEKRPIEYC